MWPSEEDEACLPVLASPGGRGQSPHPRVAVAGAGMAVGAPGAPVIGPGVTRGSSGVFSMKETIVFPTRAVWLWGRSCTAALCHLGVEVMFSAPKVAGSQEKCHLPLGTAPAWGWAGPWQGGLPRIPDEATEGQRGPVTCSRPQAATKAQN